MLIQYHTVVSQGNTNQLFYGHLHEEELVTTTGL